MVTTMTSTLRNDTSLALLGARLIACMEKCQHLTLGQLLYEALQDHAGHDMPLDVALNLRRLTNLQLVELVEHYTTFKG